MIKYRLHGNICNSGLQPDWFVHFQKIINKIHTSDLRLRHHVVVIVLVKEKGDGL